MSKTKSIKNIREANEEMLRYFNALYSEHLAELQSAKSRLFEINVKLDELVKTKNIYSLNADYRKNLFSPLNSEGNENEKEQGIRHEIENLTEERNLLEDKIELENRNIKSIETRLSKLNLSKASVQNLQNELGIYISKSSEDNKPEISEDSNDYMEASDTIRQHGKNILMISTFDKTYTSTVMDKRIRSEIASNSHKLEMIRDVIRTDPNRAKVTIDEVLSNSKNIMLVIDDHLKRNFYYFDDKKNIRSLIEDFVVDAQDKHPGIVFDTDLNNLNIQPTYIRLLTLYKLLDIFFDNIYKHSKASHVRLSVSEVNGKIDVYLNDNGIGIPDNYESKSPWYSGLKRAKELIYLLDGNIMLTNENGTTIRFRYDING